MRSPQGNLALWGFLMKGYGEYPANWREIAHSAKKAAGWRCERCRHPNDPSHGYTLTVHHLVPDKGLCENWNLAVLCQRCHLSVQNRVDMFQELLPGAPISDWFVPHLAGFREWQKRNREWREKSLDTSPGRRYGGGMVSQRIQKWKSAE